VVTSDLVTTPTGSSSSDRPGESWTLSASKIEYETDQTSSDNARSEWNLAPLTGS
jgi:hypothetical protein